MNTDLNRTATALSRGHTLRIQDGQGVLLQALTGRLWLTQEGDTRDIVLEAGDEARISRPGLSLVHALQDARVLVLSDAAPAAHLPPALKLIAERGRTGGAASPADGAAAVRPVPASAALAGSLHDKRRPSGLRLAALWQ